MLKGIAQIYVSGREWGGRIFWGDELAASTGGWVEPWKNAPLLLSLRWIMGAYVRAFDTCWACRKRK